MVAQLTEYFTFLSEMLLPLIVAFPFTVPDKSMSPMGVLQVYVCVTAGAALLVA